MFDLHPVVLTLDTGIVHEDYEETATWISSLGGVRKTCSIYDEHALGEAIVSLTNNEIDLIETRHIRKWQQNWKKVKPIVEKVEAAAAVHRVPMVPTPSMFRWNSDKAGYLGEMARGDVAITPTRFVHYQQPFRFAGALAEYPAGIVVKPSTGARSHGLRFVRTSRNGPGTGKAYEISTPMEAEEDRPATNHTELLDELQLEQYFERYRALFRDEIILVQELVGEKTEYSAVMLSGVPPYYIKRIEGPATGVGHDAFGGTNAVEPAPGSQLVRFVNKVRHTMPPLLRDEPIVRVDVLVTPRRGPMLLEIESGGPRLFNTKDLADTAEPYAAMLLSIAQDSRKRLRVEGSRSGGVNRNLAPTVEVLQGLFGDTSQTTCGDWVATSR